MTCVEALAKHIIKHNELDDGNLYANVGGYEYKILSGPEKMYNNWYIMVIRKDGEYLYDRPWGSAIDTLEDALIEAIKKSRVLGDLEENEQSPTLHSWGAFLNMPRMKDESDDEYRNRLANISEESCEDDPFIRDLTKSEFENWYDGIIANSKGHTPLERLAAFCAWEHQRKNIAAIQDECDNFERLLIASDQQYGELMGIVEAAKKHIDDHCPEEAGELLDRALIHMRVLKRD